MPEQFLMVTTNQSVREVSAFQRFPPKLPLPEVLMATNLGQGSSVFSRQDSLWKEAVNFKPLSDGVMISDMWQMTDAPGDASVGTRKDVIWGISS